MTGVQVEVEGGCDDCPFWTGDDFGSRCVAPDGPDLPVPETRASVHDAPRTFPKGCPLPVLVDRTNR